MCPLCLSTTALLASGLGSVGVISTVAAVIWRGKGPEKT